MAVLKAESLGLRPFCVTIDEHASDYLPYLFGKQSYVVIHDAEQLIATQTTHAVPQAHQISPLSRIVPL